MSRCDKQTITLPVQRFKLMLYMSIAIGLGAGSLFVYYSGLGC